MRRSVRRQEKRNSGLGRPHFHIGCILINRGGNRMYFIAASDVFAALANIALQKVKQPNKTLLLRTFKLLAEQHRSLHFHHTYCIFLQ
jgi:hypothetical protein